MMCGVSRVFGRETELTFSRHCYIGISMQRTATLLLTVSLATTALAQGYDWDTLRPQPRARSSELAATDPPFLWEYAEAPYGYPKGNLYTSPEGTFSAQFGDVPTMHQLRPMGKPMLLYQGTLKHREDIVSNVHVTLAPGLRTDDAELMRTFVLDSHQVYEKTLSAKRLRIAIRDHTPSNGPMLLEFEVEYKLEDIPMRSCGFWALTPQHMLRAYAQYCPLLNAEEIAIARHFPTTVSLPGVDALSLARKTAEPSSTSTYSGLFRTLELKDGVSLVLPPNWTPLSESAKQTLDASRVAWEIEAIGEPLDSTLPFAANLYGEGRHVLAMINLRYYAQMTKTQQDVRDLNGETLQEIDDGLHSEVETLMQRTGQTLNWLGARRVVIGDLVALVCSYERITADRLDHFCVRLVRIYDGPRSFTLTLSYRKSQAILLKPICDHIMRSLRRKAGSASSPVLVPLEAGR